MAAETASATAGDAVQTAWDALGNVERTCLRVAQWRAKASEYVRHPSTGQPLFADPYSAAIAARTIPQSVAAAFDAERIGAGSSGASSGAGSASSSSGGSASTRDRDAWMAARTAEVDAQALAAAEEAAARCVGGGPLQVVILGAGMDARAWRLSWPAARVRVWEVDSAQILALKARAFAGLGASTTAPAESVERIELALDLRDPGALARALAARGHDPQLPTLWLAEGLIGYLSADDGLRLLADMRRMSAPGSGAVITAPPTVGDREAFAAQGVALHHATFEQPEATAERARAAGWDVALVGPEEQRARYGIAGAQPVLALRLPASAEQ